MTKSRKTTNPFPGLRPFESDEYRLFFGREGQADALISRLQRSRFLAVVGTSGSGKSSLVRAGLLPALRGGMMAGAGSGWRIAIMRPGSDPIGNLALALAKEEVLLEAGGGLPQAEVEAIIEASLRRGSLGLVEVARQARLAEPEKLLIVVDQFEELFRFRAARGTESTSDDASAFVKLLLEASQQREFSIYVVPTMRSDFLGDCAQFQGLPEAINDGQYLIPRMTRDERRFAITGPVGVTRGKITEPLVNRLMNDVGDNPDQLPILQHALMRTWNYWAAQRLNGDPIGLEHYEAVGTMSSALSEHADEAYNELPDERSRLNAEILFKALTERGADNREIRRPTRLKDICVIANASQGEVSKVIEVFRGGGRSFLMPPAGVPLEPETVIDISHESLIRNWERLQAWVKDEADSARIYRRLAGAATDYHQGAGGLLDDVTLQYVLKWQEKSKPGWHWGVRYHPDYNTAMAYLERSTLERDVRIEAEKERERRELETARNFADTQARAARRLRWLAAGMAVMSLLALATALWGLNSRRQAIKSKNEALAFAETAQRAQATAVESERAAKREKDNALESARIAQEQKDKADKSAEDAKKAQASAVKSANAARAAQAKAEKSNKDLETSTRSLQLEKEKSDYAMNRSSEMALGVASLQREDYSRALTAFSKALSWLEVERERPADNEAKANMNFAQVSLLTNLGATQRKLGEADQTKISEAVTSYECARALFTEPKPQPGSAQATADAEACRQAEIPVRHEAMGQGEVTTESLLKRSNEESALILSDILYGAAHAYRHRATSVREEFNRTQSKQGGGVPEGSTYKSSLTPEVRQALEKAEGYFSQALRVQEETLKLKETDPGRVARGYEELARARLDNGKVKEAEAAFIRAVELRRLDSNDRAELVGSLRELGEFYQGQEGEYDNAVRVFNEMITVQEDITVEGLAQEGKAIANSYVDLGQIHLAKGKDTMADDAFRIAKILQETAILLQQREKVQPTSPQERTIVRQLNVNLDELGDAYAKLGKFSDAEVVYLTALSQKTAESDLAKSYEKLGGIYQRQKDYGKAQETYHRLLILYRDKPGSVAYAGALFKIAAFYAAIPEGAAEAVSYYNQSRKIFQEKGSWEDENLILFRLTKLYEKQGQVTERAAALKDRAETLAAYVDQLVAGKLRPGSPTRLVSEYLHAVDALGFFHQGKNDAEAEPAYQRAFEARGFITDKIRDEKVLKFYVAVLSDYQALLSRSPTKKTLAAEVGRVAQGFRDALSKAEESKLTRESRTAAAQ